MQSKNLGSGYGGATLIMLFSVLCMTVFAVLAFSSAGSQLRLSERYASSVSEYYAADTEATRIFASLAESGGNFRGEIERLRLDGLDISEEYRNGGESVYLDFLYPINDSLGLDVRLGLENGVWTIHKWLVKDLSDWEFDDGMNLPIF